MQNIFLNNQKNPQIYQQSSESYESCDINQSKTRFKTIK